MKVVLHDLDARYEEMIAPKCDRTISADGKYAPCQACFGNLFLLFGSHYRRYDERFH